MADIPKCRNKQCDRSDTFILADKPTFYTIACRTCKGVHVITRRAGWRAGEQQAHYQQHGLPEYERKVGYFFLGRNHL